METIKWVLCPICGNKTRTIMQEDTELKNFPLYCPKCKQQTLVNVKHFVVSVSIDSANSQYDGLPAKSSILDDFATGP